MIIDVHTHVFPAEVRDNRDAYLALDPTFRELYSRPHARIATGDELLDSMDTAGVDVAVTCGFAWRDAQLCRRHNDDLLRLAANSDGRIVAFCTVNPSDASAYAEIERCAAAGARGLGELRPASQGYDLADGEASRLLAWAAERHGLALLFHASEPVGHAYPGKAGLPLDHLWRFIEAAPKAIVIAAHWGGGLPFYAAAPEVRTALASTYVDTAATGFLYTPEVFPVSVGLFGADCILFGSDWPLVDQRSAIDDVQHAPIDDAARHLILGENARRLLGLNHG